MKAQRLRWSAIEAILGQWVRYEVAGRAWMEPFDPAVRWRGNPERLLWACTVGSKVERCPRIRPGETNGSSRWVPAVEYATRIQIAIDLQHGQLGQLKSLLARGGHAAESALLSPMKTILRITERDKALLHHVKKTREYRRGMEFLAHELWKCCMVDDDTQFLVYVCQAILEAGGARERLRLMMTNAGLTAADVAEVLGVSTASVWHWTSGSKPTPPDRVEQLAEWIEALKGQDHLPQENAQVCDTRYVEFTSEATRRV